eukprot:5892300-Ditylum_brightwellii.AAC.1
MVINEGINVSDDTDGSMPFIETCEFAAKLLGNAVMVEANSAFGIMELDLTEDACLLFTATLDELRDMHAPEISGVDAE